MLYVMTINFANTQKSLHNLGQPRIYEHWFHVFLIVAHGHLDQDCTAAVACEMLNHILCKFDTELTTNLLFKFFPSEFELFSTSFIQISR